MRACRQRQWPTVLALVAMLGLCGVQPLWAETEGGSTGDGTTEDRLERLRAAIEREREALERERERRRSMEEELGRMRDELERTRDELEALERELEPDADGGN